MHCQRKCTKGKQCSRQITSGKYCWQHKKGCPCKKRRRSRRKRSRSRRSRSRSGSRPKSQIGRGYPTQVTGWTVYGYSDCSYALRAISYLKQKNINPRVIHINRGDLPNFIAFLKKQGLMDAQSTHQTSPIIFDKKQFIGGFDDLSKHLQK